MKKHMAKIFSLLFALVLMACMAVPAFAAEIEPTDTGDSVVAYSGAITPRAANGNKTIHSNDGQVTLHNHWSIKNYAYSCYNNGNSQSAVTFRMTGYGNQGVAPGGSCQFGMVSGSKTLSAQCQSYGSATISWVQGR